MPQALASWNRVQKTKNEGNKGHQRGKLREDKGATASNSSLDPLFTSPWPPQSRCVGRGHTLGNPAFFRFPGDFYPGIFLFYIEFAWMLAFSICERAFWWERRREKKKIGCSAKNLPYWPWGGAFIAALIMKGFFSYSLLSSCMGIF